MRTGYTYDDEMPSSQGSYVNNERRRQKFTGIKIGHIKIDPATRQMVIVPLTEQEQAEEDEKQKQNKK